MLAAKLVLAPTFVIGASVAARRYGARTGGLIGGLPVVAGPILLVFALDHGRAFAAGASAATLLGIVSLIAFVVVYARLAGGAHWGASLILGWTVFFAMTAVLNAFTVSPALALVCVLATVGVGLLVLPHSRDERLGGAMPPTWDLPLRGVSALVLVLALTALAGQLGAKLSGLLAPFPVIASVLAVFTHALRGQEDLLRIMRGFVLGLVAYALFCFVLAESLGSLSIAAGFALATATALATQAIALTLSRPRPDAAAVAASHRGASHRAAASTPDTVEVAEPL